MKNFIAMAFIALISAISCTKNETTQQSSGVSDYAETHEELIQNPNKDSIQGDTVKTLNPTATEVDSMMQKR